MKFTRYKNQLKSLLFVGILFVLYIVFYIKESIPYILQENEFDSLCILFFSSQQYVISLPIFFLFFSTYYELRENPYRLIRYRKVDFILKSLFEVVLYSFLYALFISVMFIISLILTNIYLKDIFETLVKSSAICFVTASAYLCIYRVLASFLKNTTTLCILFFIIFAEYIGIIFGYLNSISLLSKIAYNIKETNYLCNLFFVCIVFVVFSIIFAFINTHKDFLKKEY